MKLAIEPKKKPCKGTTPETKGWGCGKPTYHRHYGLCKSECFPAWKKIKNKEVNKRNKYNASKTSYGGRIYDSKLEAGYAEQLDWRKKAGEVKEWEAQHRFDLRINGKHWRHYKIDFKVINSDGVVDFVEIKGFPTSEWKQKFDVLKLIFDEITEGFSARLWLNDKIVKQSL